MLTKYNTKVNRKQKDIRSAYVLLSKSTGFIEEITYDTGLTWFHISIRTPLCLYIKGITYAG
jgi:hypothetical protein